MLTRDELIKACLARHGAGEDYPFGSENAVYKVMGKMFALIPLTIPDEIGIVLKCDPVLVPLLRDTYAAVQTADYMSKAHWNYVLIDGTIPADEILDWIEDSYQLVVKKLTRKQREALGQS